MKKSIKIASGQGFWGDLPRAPLDQVRFGDIDYLMMDYLAEVTMSILQKQKVNNPLYGYARDFVNVVNDLLPEIADGKVKILSNAGGVNPHACKDAILEKCKQHNFKNIRIAVIDGDDILTEIPDLIRNNTTLNNMDTNENIDSVLQDVLSANVYFGAAPMVEALNNGAQIVITGRVTDTGLCLAPMIHEFGWPFSDYNLMASGTIAGHIIECGAQSSGGNFTDWHLVDDFVNIGFPIIEAFPDGSFEILKHPNTGGLIHSMTIKEQLLYEIGDPKSYITPDCVADFTSVTLKDKAYNRVRVEDVRGYAPTEYYKVSVSYTSGFKLTSTLTYYWPDALEKARLASQILSGRAAELHLKIDNFHTDFIGYNACDEVPDKHLLEYCDEICLRIAVSGKHRSDLDRFGMEVAPLILTGPNAVTGFAGGRPKASEIVAYWPALISKQMVSPTVHFFNS